MSRRIRRLLAVLYVGLLTTLPVAAQTPRPPADGTPAVEPEPVRRWLDEVRSQRQIRQEHRRTAKEARDARRRWIDPWGAARQELREQETQRRHEEFLEQIEHDREVFRNQAPWMSRQPPWQEETAGPPATSSKSLTDGTAEAAGPMAPQVSPYPLPGWDNRWYYRGF